VENILDPVHVEWLHHAFTNYAAAQLSRADRPRQVLKHVEIGFDVAEYGIIKRRLLEGETKEHDDWRVGHWLVFPNAQKGPDMLRFRVPVDDTHVAQWYYAVRPASGASQRPEDIPLYEMPSPTLDEHEQPQWSQLAGAVDPQDNAIFVGQGPVYDRSQETLGESDRGVILFRRLLEEQIRLVEQGQDPTINVFRDPAQNGCLELPTERRDSFLSGNVGKEGAVRPSNATRYPSLL
jgi:5,5'-dehydrodivanillate O-demethylase